MIKNNRQKNQDIFSCNFFPKNHRGQMIVVFVLILLILIVGVGYYAINSNSATLTGGTTGNTISESDSDANTEITGNEDSGCRTIDVAASYLVVGPQSCSGENEDATCTIQLQNKESVTILAEPIFNCETSDKNEKITADTQSLSPEEIGSFSVNYNNAGLDWTCTLYNAQTTKQQEVCE